VSASVGKWHLGSDNYWPLKHGFDVNVAGHTHGSPSGYFYPYLNPKQPWNPDIPTLDGGEDGEYLTERLTDESIRFIEKNKSSPFFLYLTHYAVHTPIQARKRLIEKYEAKLKTDSSQFNAGYAAMIESVDRSVGRIMKTLARLGLDENTVVIFTSDNGGLSAVTRNHPLREGKGYLYEGGIRVPLIVRWPGKIEAGAVSDVPVIGTDLYPTIAEIAGDKASPGKVVDGKSLMPLLTVNGEWDREDLYWYYPHYSPQAKQPGAAVRSGNYKLIEHYDPPGMELYNLSDDIGEKVDLASKMPDKAAELSKKIHDWLEESGTIMHTDNAAYRP
jgi:arylsulfatase A